MGRCCCRAAVSLQHGLGGSTFSGWAVGDLTVPGEGPAVCISLTIAGPVREATVRGRVLPVGWPFRLQLPPGTHPLYVRVEAQGAAQFQVQVSGCKRQAKVQLLDLGAL